MPLWWLLGFINDNPSITNLNISGVFTSWESGAPLSVTITADGGFGDGSLELSSSTFTLDYDNGEAPAPEAFNAATRYDL